MSKPTVEQTVLLNTSRTYVLSPEDNNSVFQVIDRFPQGVPATVAHQALGMSKAKHRELVAEATEKLKAALREE